MQRRPESISPVEAHVAYWLHYVGNRLFHELRQRALRFGVTAAESLLLRKLCEHENGAMQSRLAAQLGLHRSHISRLAMRLEIKGFINREKSVSDRRALTLTLTTAGRLMVPSLAAAADKTNARNFAGAGDAAHETIERVTKWIVFRHRFRFVPPVRCRIREYLYLHLGIDCDEDGNADEVDTG